MKNKILKISTLILSTVLIMLTIIFDMSKDKVLNNEIYDDSSGIRLPKNMANVHEIMPNAPKLYYLSVYYSDAEKGEVKDDVYHNKEKAAELFEAIDSETWYYIDEEPDRSIVFNVCYHGQIIQNANRETFFIGIYANCISISYKNFDDEYQRVEYVAPEDGESEVYEKMQAIVDEIIQSSEN